MATRHEILSMINWEYTYSVEDQERILTGSNLRDKISIYTKLLTAVRWYDLKSILTEKELKEILSPEVIDKLNIPSLRRNYHYARRVLFG